MAAVRSIIEATEDATELYVVNVWTSFDIIAEPLVLTVATISLAVLGYLMFTGQVTMQMNQLLPRLFRWAIILALLLNMPDLYAFVYPIVTDVPDAIAAFLLAEAGGLDEDAVLGMVETVLQAGMNAASEVWKSSGYLDLSSHVISGLLLITALALAIVAMVLLMLSKLAVGILLAVGPFPLILRLLDVGRGLFEGWLRQLLTFSLVPVFVYSLIALNFTILQSAQVQLVTATTADQITLTQIIPFVLVGIANLLLLTQVLTWAGGVGGGVALAISTGAILHGAQTIGQKFLMPGARVAGRGVQAGVGAAATGAAAMGAPRTADALRRLQTLGRGAQGE